MKIFAFFRFITKLSQLMIEICGVVKHHKFLTLERNLSQIKGTEEMSSVVGNDLAHLPYKANS